MNTQGKTYTVVFMFIVSLVFVFVLALVNSALSDQVARNDRITRAKAVLNAMGFTYADSGEALRLFESQVENFTPSGGVTGGEVYYRARKGAQSVYAVISRGPGLWGTITFVVAVNADVTRVVGVDIISQNETPGLGGRIDEPWFKKQFRGETIPPGGKITAGPAGPGDANLSDGRFDAITGASLTSNLFSTMLNTALGHLRAALIGTPAAAGGKE